MFDWLTGGSDPTSGAIPLVSVTPDIFGEYVDPSTGIPIASGVPSSGSLSGSLDTLWGGLLTSGTQLGLFAENAYAAKLAGQIQQSTNPQPVATATGSSIPAWAIVAGVAIVAVVLLARK